MRPIQQISGNFRDMPPLLRAPLPGPSMEDLDAPAYSRGLTSLPEVRRRQAMRAADRVAADNRSFNQHFWSIMRSEAGGVPSGIGLGRLARWLSGIIGGQRPGGG